jgi:integrase
VLYLQCIHCRKTRLITTHFRLFPHEWDSRRGCILFEGAAPARAEYLQAVARGISQKVRQMQKVQSLLASRGEYTVEQLREYYSESVNEMLVPFAGWLIKKLRQNRQPQTAATYQAVINSFLRFRNGGDIRLDAIDSFTVEEYEQWLKKSGVCMNSVSCYMRAFRAMYNKAVKNGFCLQKSPFQNVYTGVEKTVKRALTREEFRQLRDLDLHEHPNLDSARDMFLFSFYMRGMSFVDMANLKKTDINDGYLTYLRRKTRQRLVIKMEPRMTGIIEKYCHRTIDGFLLPVFTPHNRNEQHLLRNYNLRLRRISAMLNLRNPLTSYVARHTWATMALHEGLPVKIISEGMGHESENTTRIYLAALDQSVLDTANRQVIELI